MMQYDVQSFVQVLFTTPGGQLAIVISLLAPLAFMWWVRGEVRRACATQMVLLTMYHQASAADVDVVLEIAEALGKKDLVLGQLAEIRRHYGRTGLKRAHLIWLYAVVQGECQVQSPPPPFHEQHEDAPALA